jgi:hypothetical protein
VEWADGIGLSLLVPLVSKHRYAAHPLMLSLACALLLPLVEWWCEDLPMPTTLLVSAALFEATFSYFLVISNVLWCARCVLPEDAEEDTAPRLLAMSRVSEPDVAGAPKRSSLFFALATGSRVDDDDPFRAGAIPGVDATRVRALRRTAVLGVLVSAVYGASAVGMALWLQALCVVLMLSALVRAQRSSGTWWKAMRAAVVDAVLSAPIDAV